MQRRHRLRLSSDFERLRREGHRWHHPLAILVVGANDIQQSRFGFSASRRVGKAVERNRAKRLLREAVERHYRTVQGGWDCLLIARRATSQASFLDVYAAVEQLFRRAGILNVR